MAGFLLLGLFIGMAHALEADHLAAVGTLASSGQSSPKRLAILGASWGIGHTTTLFVISLPVIAFGKVLSERVASGMEFFVGVMLVGLGARVLWKLRAARVHFHAHDHGNGPHLHAHSHLHSCVPHSEDPHEHRHGAFSLRAYLIGLAHGAAGSAGLVALAAAATQDAVIAMVYILIFGFGSVLGMAALTYTASWPLSLAETRATWLLSGVQFLVACVAIFIGVQSIFANGPMFLGNG